MPNLNQWSSLEGGVFTLMVDSQTTGACPRLGWMSSTCPSGSTSTLPTCPVPGRLPVTTGNCGHWFLGATGREGGKRGQGIYLLPCHDVPSPLFLPGVLPTRLSSSLFVLGLMVSPLSSGCGWEQQSVTRLRPLPQVPATSCSFLTPCPPPYELTVLNSLQCKCITCFCFCFVLSRFVCWGYNTVCYIQNLK